MVYRSIRCVSTICVLGLLCAGVTIVADEPKLQQAPQNVPLEPVMLEETPAISPSVTYEKGALTILAQNASFSDVLRAIQRCTGTEIDIPPHATERVAGVWGPGTVQDVIASFLEGSRFNYIILGSNAAPSAPTRVILSVRPGERTGQKTGGESNEEAQRNPTNKIIVPSGMAEQKENHPIVAATDGERVTANLGFGSAMPSSDVERRNETGNVPEQSFGNDTIGPAKQGFHRIPHHHRRR
jgi:hypothetical protein